MEEAVNQIKAALRSALTSSGPIGTRHQAQNNGSLHRALLPNCLLLRQPPNTTVTVSIVLKSYIRNYCEEQYTSLTKKALLIFPFSPFN